MQAFNLRNSSPLRFRHAFVENTSLSLFLSGAFLSISLRAEASLRLDIARAGPNVVLTWTNASVALPDIKKVEEALTPKDQRDRR